MAWRVAKSLDKLLAQINAYAPNRSKISDGSIGDTAHSARVSDHNPDSRGVVHARDFTHSPATGFDAHAFVRRLATAGDRRIKYLISNRQIWNPSIAKRWRPYSGINGHTQHAHVSCVYGSLEDNTANWPGLGSAGWVVVEPSTPSTPAEPKGILGMSKLIKYRSQKKQTVPTKGHRVLRIDADKISRLVSGPAEYAATINVTAKNLEPGNSLWLRVVRAGYKKGKAIKVGRTVVYEEFPGTTGATFASVTAIGAINKDYGGGYDTRVYILATTNQPGLIIDDVRVEGLRN